MKIKEIGGNVWGYGYDFWLFSVGAKAKNVTLPKIEKLNCRAAKYIVPDSFAFPLCNCEGVFFDFTSEYNELGGAVFIRQSDCERESYFAPPWMSREEKRNVHYVKIEEEYKRAVMKAVNFAIDCSPVRKAYLLVRCQCLGRKNVIGMLTSSQIEELIKNDDLLANVAYTIYDHPDCLRDSEKRGY